MLITQIIKSVSNKYMQSTKKKQKVQRLKVNLEKYCAIQSQIHSVIIIQKEITDQAEINKQIFSFYQFCFRVKFSFKQTKQKLFQNLAYNVWKKINHLEMMSSLRYSMNAFWDEIKQPFLASIHKAFLNKELSSSQKQAVIKMLGKKRQR